MLRSWIIPYEKGIFFDFHQHVAKGPESKQKAMPSSYTAFCDPSRTVAIFHSDDVTPEQLNAAKYRGLGTRQHLACFEHAEVYIAVCFVLPNER